MICFNCCINNNLFPKVLDLQSCTNGIRQKPVTLPLYNQTLSLYRCTTKPLQSLFYLSLILYICYTSSGHLFLLSQSNYEIIWNYKPSVMINEIFLPQTIICTFLFYGCTYGSFFQSLKRLYQYPIVVLQKIRKY